MDNAHPDRFRGRNATTPLIAFGLLLAAFPSPANAAGERTASRAAARPAAKAAGKAARRAKVLPPAYDHVVAPLRPQVEALRRRIVKPLSSKEGLPESVSRGFLLEGASGSGKLTVARAIKREIDQLNQEGEGTNVRTEIFGVSAGMDKLREFSQDLKPGQKALAIVRNANVIFSGGRGGEPFGPHLMEFFQDARSGGGEKGSGLIVLGLADSSPDRPEIDPLLLGSGYLETGLRFPRPDVPARREALPVLAKGLEIKLDTVDQEKFLQRTHGYTYGELTKVLREAKDLAESDGGRLSDSHLMAALNKTPSEMQRRYDLKVPEGRISDVAGAKEAKDAIGRVLINLQHPEAFKKLGVEPMDNGIFFYGPPGNGKTELARMVAAELNLPFASLSAANVRNKYVGESARAIREAYRDVAEAGGGVLFLDEVDGLAPPRGEDMGNDPGARETTTALLDTIDGMRSSNKVVVIMATNQPQRIDEALTRHGRVSRAIYIGELTQAERHGLLKTKTRNMRLAEDVDLEALSGKMDDFTGAAVTAIPQRAAELAIVRTGVEGVKEVTGKDFMNAIKEVRSELTTTRDQSFVK